MLFFPIQQELDCISDDGRILGKIKFDHAKGGHIFIAANESIILSDSEGAIIADRLLGLDLGKYTISMQDDD